MRLGYRERERFWITLIVRFAFGFLFLIAAANIFTYYDQKGASPGEKKNLAYFGRSLTLFADDLSQPYEDSWINIKWPWWEYRKEINTYVAGDVGIYGVLGFLYTMPFIFLILALLILTGIFLRPALRLGAFYMVLLGLGRYVAGDTATTAQDFIYAAFLCIGLYMASEEKQVRAELQSQGPTQLNLDP